MSRKRIGWSRGRYNLNFLQTSFYTAFIFIPNMPKEDKEDLRSLPPEERIRKLKELEKKRKKEIAEAQENIRESEEEIKDRLKWLDKVPMPEFAQEDLEGLSEEARQVLKERKGIKEKKKRGPPGIGKKR